jgi:hypothetical protein
MAELEPNAGELLKALQAQRPQTILSSFSSYSYLITLLRSCNDIAFVRVLKEHLESSFCLIVRPVPEVERVRRVIATIGGAVAVEGQGYYCTTAELLDVLLGVVVSERTVADG